MLSNNIIEVRVHYRPLWGFGIVRRAKNWTIKPNDLMNDKDVFELAHKLIEMGAEVNVSEQN